MLGQAGLGASSSLTPMSAGANANLSNLNMNNWSTLGLPPGQPLQGLGRRVMDRAATRLAQQNADYSSLEQQTELFAPEVLMIQFRFFDGLQWLAEWNTEQLGGIPLAIEIVLVLQARTDDPLLEPALATRDTSAQSAVWQYDAEHVYRLVVNLPAAELIDSTSATQDSTSTAASDGGST
jgi:hypothetical protein